MATWSDGEGARSQADSDLGHLERTIVPDRLLRRLAELGREPDTCALLPQVRVRDIVMPAGLLQKMAPSVAAGLRDNTAEGRDAAEGPAMEAVSTVPSECLSSSRVT